MAMTGAIFAREKWSERVYGLTTDHGRQLWTRIALRKPAACWSCGTALEPRDSAYRPITNADNRMHRLCRACVEGAA